MGIFILGINPNIKIPKNPKKSPKKLVAKPVTI